MIARSVEKFASFAYSKLMEVSSRPGFTSKEALISLPVISEKRIAVVVGSSPSVVNDDAVLVVAP